ncbi:TIGR03000 domain-containing protein [Limnoglobus roseus]|uniref:TIGR03000 domain-containing protein n=1 Tax=Limnoglobus roseus TaxID=2598579 RepID=A0A5C1ASN8_9BACT|nr:class I SAM-dependent methyltransferase [Limnoglobus roseus]QEL20264.1 TIGR03000 domain-containing protein [Limnoglobus roseus]
MLRLVRFPILLLAVGLATAALGPWARAQDKPKADDKAKADDKKAVDKKADDKKPAAKAVLKVTVPNDAAELKIENQTMKTTGKTREFDVVGLDPKKTYEYELVVKFEPNNYTTITRKKTVSFKGSDATITADLTKDDPSDKAVIRFVPTPDDIVAKMLDLGKVGKDDVVYDLGCGDGRIVIAAVRDKHALAGVGIDLDPERVKESKEAVKKAKLEDKVDIRQGDVLEIKDISEASVVMIYMSDELGKLLEPRLKKLLQPGTRIVSHRFTLGDWKPEKTITVQGDDGDEYTLHLWTVPKK